MHHRIFFQDATTFQQAPRSAVANKHNCNEPASSPRCSVSLAGAMITNCITYFQVWHCIARRTLHRCNWNTPVKGTCPCQTLSAHSYIFRSTVQAGMHASSFRRTCKPQHSMRICMRIMSLDARTVLAASRTTELNCSRSAKRVSTRAVAPDSDPLKIRHAIKIWRAIRFSKLQLTPRGNTWHCISASRAVVNICVRINIWGHESKSLTCMQRGLLKFPPAHSHPGSCTWAKGLKAPCAAWWTWALDLLACNLFDQFYHAHAEAGSHLLWETFPRPQRPCPLPAPSCTERQGTRDTAMTKSQKCWHLSRKCNTHWKLNGQPMRNCQKKARYHDVADHTCSLILWWKFPLKSPIKVGTMMLYMTYVISLNYNISTKESMQDHIHRRKMSWVLLSMHLCIHLRLRPNDSFVEDPVECRSHRERGKTPCLNWNNQKTQSPKNECETMSTETEHGTIRKHNLQRMNAGPYPQKKDVDSIALNAYLHPLEAPTNRFASTSSWRPLAQRTWLQKLHTWIPRDSMIQLKTNQSSQSHTTSTENRNQFSIQPLHVSIADFYTQTLLHTDAFTHRSFYTQRLLYTQTLLHTDTFTHRRIYTQTLLHTEAFTHRSFYTQRLLHTDSFTHRRFTHRRFYAQTLLHTDAFTLKHFSRTEAFTHRSFYTQKHFHTQRPDPWNRNFTSVFGDRTSFRV